MVEPNQASWTALGVAVIRALHYEDDIKPKVFEDWRTSELVKPEEREAIVALMKGNISKVLPGVDRLSADELEKLVPRLAGLMPATPLLLARARYNEESLGQAMQRGVTQYVLIGAGMDTFALRRQDLAERLQVFEVDLAASQEFKRSRILEAGLVLPSNLHFAPADFERDGVADVLRRMPFDSAKPAFFAWLGVMMYLTVDAALKTLASVRSIAAPGSEIVFDYFDAAHFAPEARTTAANILFEMVAARGEPFRSCFHPQELAAMLSRLGWELVDEIGPEEQKRRFWSERHETPAAIGRIARARAV
jgi:methyltransferase (TIGR00027 family)